MKEQAISLLNTLDKRKKKYDKINKSIRELQGDFPTYAQDIDTEIEAGLVKLLDAILENEVASYYLHECQTMNGGGEIKENGKRYPIRNIDDVRKYVFRERASDIF